jgi:hypothetical protein
VKKSNSSLKKSNFSVKKILLFFEMAFYTKQELNSSETSCDNQGLEIKKNEMQRKIFFLKKSCTFCTQDQKQIFFLKLSKSCQKVPKNCQKLPKKVAKKLPNFFNFLYWFFLSTNQKPSCKSFPSVSRHDVIRCRF